jgi:hypothetical protein
MEFKYSELIDPSQYVTEGLCGDIPLRKHRNTTDEDIGATRCQKDWSRLVTLLRDYRGGLDPKWSVMSVCIPETLPDRLEIISYANEFAFLYDGMHPFHSTLCKS